MPTKPRFFEWFPPKPRSVLGMDKAFCGSREFLRTRMRVKRAEESQYDDVLADPDADRPNGEGLLYGVPILLKDLGSGLAGRRQESGSKLFKDHTVEATDPLVDNYLRAGLIPLGRSTTPEFGMTFDTATDYLGRAKVTRNPWKLARTPGGSSGGSASAVAAGVLPIGMSSDGGGSTRIPASFCGLVGLKATRGRVPRPLSQSEYISRISIDGVVTRTSAQSRR